MALSRETHRRVLVAVIMLSTGLMVGTTGYAVSTLILPLEAEFGWSRAAINLALSLGQVASAVLSPAIGQLIDRLGSRVTMTASLALASLGLGAMSLLPADDAPVGLFYASLVVVMAGFPGASLIGASRLVFLWFSGTKTLGFVSSANNVMGMVCVKASAALIAAHGWRSATGAFSAMFAAVALAAAVVVRHPPVEDPRETPLEEISLADADDPALAGEDPSADDDPTAPMLSAEAPAQLIDTRPDFTLGQAARTRTFYTLMVGFGCLQATYGGLLAQLAPHLEQSGFSVSQASSGIAVVGATGVISKLVAGYLCERITGRWTACLSLSIQIAAAVLLATMTGDALWAAVALYGLSFGAVGALLPVLVREAFGLAHFASILGMFNLVGVVPGFAAPYAAGLSYDADGTYRRWFFALSGVFAVGIAALILSPSPPAPAAQPDAK